MNKILDEFRNQRSFVANMNWRESKSRISGFLDWLDKNETTVAILSEIENNDRAIELLKKSDFHHPPPVSHPEDVMQIGLYFMRQAKSGKDIYTFSNIYGIRPSFPTTNVQLWQDEVVKRYIKPVLDCIENKLIERTVKNEDKVSYSPPVVNILSGDFRGAILNINSTLTESSQIIKSTAKVDEDVKEELVKLLDELKQVLAKTPQNNTDDAEAVAWAAETLIKAKTAERTNLSKVEITKDGLMKAARNLAAVMPLVLPIAERIIFAIERIK